MHKILIALATLITVAASSHAAVLSRVSVDANGAQVAGASRRPTISGDGRQVAFESDAVTLAGSDTNAVADVYRALRPWIAPRDVRRGSIGAPPFSYEPSPYASQTAALSADGRYVYFETSSPTLVPGDTNGFKDIFRKDLADGSLVRVSVTSTGAQATAGNATLAVCSADGNRVAFGSTATNMVAGDTNGFSDIFLRDLAAGTTVRVSLTDTGAAPAANSSAPSISADGTKVAFTCGAKDVVAGAPAGFTQVYVRDLSAGTIRCASLSTTGAFAGGSCGAPQISADGRYVVYYSAATNLVAGDTNGVSDVFLRDLATNTTTRLSVSTAGTQANAACNYPSIGGADSRYITFTSAASTLAPEGGNSRTQVFVRDRLRNTTALVTANTAAAPSMGSCQYTRLDDEGRYVAFQSDAADLVAGDTNGVADAFVADLAVFQPDAQIRLASVPTFDPALAGQAVTVKTGETASYVVRVCNKGTYRDRMRVTAAPPSKAGWTVALAVGATDITALATGAGWDSAALAPFDTANPTDPAAYLDLTVTMQAGPAARPSPSIYALAITATSLENHATTPKTDTVTATTTWVNTPPVAEPDAAGTIEDQALTVAAPAGVLTNDTDLDGDVLTATLVTPCAHGTLALRADGSYTYQPAADFNGTDTFAYRASDGADTSATVTVTLTVTARNDAPTFAVGANPTRNEDCGAVTIAGWATGISPGPTDEAGQTLAFVISANSNPALFGAGPTVATDGTLSFTPAANANGAATIGVRLTDSGGTAGGGADSSVAQSFTITVNSVNDAPTFGIGTDTVVSEDAGAQTLTDWATDVSAGPADEAGQTLTFAITGNTNPTLFSAGPALSANGTLTYTPTAHGYGTALISVQLSDTGGTANGGANTSIVRAFTIGVLPVNDAPSFVKGANASALEDSGPRSISAWATGITPGPNESVQTVSFTVTANSNPTLFSAGPAIAPNGTLTFTPAANANGAATIGVRIGDSGDTTNGGVNISGVQTFTITVTAVNDAPSFTRGADVSVSEDAAAQSMAGWATALSAGPADEGGQTLSFDVIGVSAPALFSAGPAIAPNGTLTFTPALNATGTATVAIRLRDTGATANGGVDTSATQSFTIALTPVNDAPSVTGMSIITAEGTPKTNRVTGSDIDGDGLTYRVGTPPTMGAVTFSTFAPGQFVYTPTPGALGSDSFTVVANDGAADSAPATVTVTIVSRECIVDDADPTGAVFSGTWVVKTPNPPAGQYAATFRDDNNKNKGLCSAQFTPTLPLGGNYSVYLRWKTSSSSLGYTVPVDINCSAGTRTRIIDQRQNGGDWYLLGLFPFAAGADPLHGSVRIRTLGSRGYVVADAVRFVRDTAENSVPIILDEAITIAEDSAGATGTLQVADADGDPVTLATVTAGARGAFSLNPTTGAYSYVPYHHSSGADTITVSATDGKDTRTASLVFTISPLELIVDNSSPAFTTTGAWTPSTSTPGYYGADCVSDNAQGKGQRTATFTPAIPCTASYGVYLWYTAGTNRSTAVPVDIAYDGGTTTVPVNQTVSGAAWVSLGTFAFRRGATGSITIRTDGTDGKYVVADAVRLVKTTQYNRSTTAFASSLTIDMNTPVSGMLPVADLDDDPLAYTQTAPPVRGWLAINADNSFTYVPYAGAGGLDTIKLRVTDGYSTPVTATLAIDIRSGGVDTILDNTSPTGVMPVGAWSNYVNTLAYGGTAIYDGNSGKGTKTVTYTPTLPEAGAYEVSLWYPAGSNRAGNVPVTVNHAGGSTTVSVDERVNGSRWWPIGTYTFPAVGGSVSIDTGGTSGYVMADAVRFARSYASPTHLVATRVSPAQTTSGTHVVLSLTPKVPAAYLTATGGLSIISAVDGTVTLDTAGKTGDFTIALSAFGESSNTVSVFIAPPLRITAPTDDPFYLMKSTAQQFQANETDVAWSIVNGVGTISAAGLYTAPATVGVCTVRATKDFRTAERAVHVVGPLTISGPTEVEVGTTAGYVSEPGAVWSVANPATGGGSIDANGLYTPPNRTTAGTMTLQAVHDFRTATKAVTVRPRITLTGPTAGEVGVPATFGANETSVVWSVTGAPGTNPGVIANGVYTPAEAGAFTVTATKTTAITRQASATITVAPNLTISGPVQVEIDTPRTYTASETGVLWSLTGDVANTLDGGAYIPSTLGTTTLTIAKDFRRGNLAVQVLPHLTLSGAPQAEIGVARTFTSSESGVVWTVTGDAPDTLVDGVYTPTSVGGKTITIAKDVRRASAMLTVLPSLHLTGPALMEIGGVATFLANEPGVAWQIAGDAPASLANGVYTPTSTGTKTITISKDIRQASATVAVLPHLTVTGPAQAEVGVARTFTASEPGVAWSITGDGPGTLVDGVYTPATAGSMTIRVAKDIRTASTTLTVLPSLGLTGPAQAEIGVPAVFTAGEAGITWQIGGDAATSLWNGVYTPGSLGVKTVTISTGTRQASAVVTVLPHLTISGPTKTEIGMARTLTASEPGVAWSITGDAPSTLVDGVYTPATTGVVTITVTKDIRQAGIAVTVLPSLGITGPTQVEIGAPATFAANEPNVTWQITVDAPSSLLNGVYTPSSAGAKTITIRKDIRTATASVTVLPHLSIAGPTDVLLGDDRTYTSEAEALWSLVNSADASTIAGGFFHPVTASTEYRIRAARDIRTAEMVVHAHGPLTMDGPTALLCGAQATFVANDTGVVWSADAGVIDTTGAYVAPGTPGVAIITARKDVRTVTHTVSIAGEQPATGVTVNKDAYIYCTVAGAKLNYGAAPLLEVLGGTATTSKSIYIGITGIAGLDLSAGHRVVLDMWGYDADASITREYNELRAYPFPIDAPPVWKEGVGIAVVPTDGGIIANTAPYKQGALPATTYTVARMPNTGADSARNAPDLEIGWDITDYAAAAKAAGLNDISLFIYQPNTAPARWAFYSREAADVAKRPRVRLVTPMAAVSPLLPTTGQVATSFEVIPNAALTLGVTDAALWRVVSGIGTINVDGQTRAASVTFNAPTTTAKTTVVEAAAYGRTVTFTILTKGAPATTPADPLFCLTDGTLTLSCTDPLTSWSAAPGQGTITAAGVYTAPSTAGDYQVTCTASFRTTTRTIHVAAPMHAVSPVLPLTSLPATTFDVVPSTVVTLGVDDGTALWRVTIGLGTIDLDATTPAASATFTAPDTTGKTTKVEAASLGRKVTFTIVTKAAPVTTPADPLGCLPGGTLALDSTDPAAYWVADPSQGYITSDGLYTAPMASGDYVVTCRASLRSTTRTIHVAPSMHAVSPVLPTTGQPATTFDVIPNATVTLGVDVDTALWRVASGTGAIGIDAVTASPSVIFTAPSTVNSTTKVDATSLGRTVTFTIVTRLPPTTTPVDPLFCLTGGMLTVNSATAGAYWAADAGQGSITPDGVYTAPMVAGDYTVRCFASLRVTNRTILVRPAFAPAITKPTGSPIVGPGTTLTFTTNHPADAWTVLGGPSDGTLVATSPTTAIYTGPASVDAARTIGIRASMLGVDGPVRNLELRPAIAITGPSVVLTSTPAADTTATFTCADAVTWSKVSGTGSIVLATGVYTAPATADGAVTIKATTSVATDYRTATFTFAVAAPLYITTGPGALPAGGTGYFGASEPGVTWSVIETGGGAIDAFGAYTAPATPGTYTVQASKDTRTGRATVAVGHSAGALALLGYLDGGSTPNPLDLTLGGHTDWVTWAPSVVGTVAAAAMPGTQFDPQTASGGQYVGTANLPAGAVVEGDTGGGGTTYLNIRHSSGAASGGRVQMLKGTGGSLLVQRANLPAGDYLLDIYANIFQSQATLTVEMGGFIWTAPEPQVRATPALTRRYALRISPAAPCTLTIRFTCDALISATAGLVGLQAVTLTPTSSALSITSPGDPVTLDPGAQATFTASEGGVSWSVIPFTTGGSIGADGVFTAAQTAGQCIVQAAKGLAIARKTVIVNPPLTITQPSADPAPITAGGTLQFVASASGVTWDVPYGAASGSITADGMYTAPATPGVYTVRATKGGLSAIAHVQVSAIAGGIITAPVDPIEVVPNGTVPFAASESVTWSVDNAPTAGAITTGGVYTAPATVGVYTVRAVGGTTDTRLVHVVAPLQVVAPAGVAEVEVGKSISFGASEPGIAWSCAPALGTIMAETGVFTAGATPGQVVVTAMKGGRSASKGLTILPRLTIASSNPSVPAILDNGGTILYGTTTRFASFHLLASEPGVAWSCSEGTIDLGTGSYLAGTVQPDGTTLGLSGSFPRSVTITASKGIRTATFPLRLYEHITDLPAWSNDSVNGLVIPDPAVGAHAVNVPFHVSGDGPGLTWSADGGGIVTPDPDGGGATFTWTTVGSGFHVRASRTVDSVTETSYREVNIVAPMRFISPNDGETVAAGSRFHAMVAAWASDGSSFTIEGGYTLSVTGGASYDEVTGWITAPSSAGQTFTITAVKDTRTATVTLHTAVTAVKVIDSFAEPTGFGHGATPATFTATDHPGGTWSLLGAPAGTGIDSATGVLTVGTISATCAVVYTYDGGTKQAYRVMTIGAPVAINVPSDPLVMGQSLAPTFTSTGLGAWTTWSVSAGSGTTDDTGTTFRYDHPAAGTVTITATKGNRTVSRTITVDPPIITSPTVVPGDPPGTVAVPLNGVLPFVTAHPVTWSVSTRVAGVQPGSIDADGTYHAPPMPCTVTVRATRTDVTPVRTQDIVVRVIAPDAPLAIVGPADMAPGATTPFRCAGTGVVWHANGGSIDPATGAFVAPASAATITITATRGVEAATHTVRVRTAPVLSITGPAAFSVAPGGTLAFVASETGVTWHSAFGAIHPHTGVYTAGAGTGSDVVTATKDYRTVAVRVAVRAHSTFTIGAPAGLDLSGVGAMVFAPSHPVSWSVTKDGQPAATATVDAFNSRVFFTAPGAYVVSGVSTRTGERESVTVTVSDPSLLCYLPLTEGDSYTASDASGQAGAPFAVLENTPATGTAWTAPYGGTARGAAWTGAYADEESGAFTQSAAYLRLQPGLLRTSRMTLAFWTAESPKFGDGSRVSVLGTADAAGNLGPVMVTRQSSSAVEGLRALSLGKTDNPTALGTYLTPTWCQPSNPMADGLWHHVTLAVDGAAWWWYIDGQLRYSGTGMDDLPVDLLTLNGRPDGQQYWSLPASYSNLRVYNRPLAEAEARTLFEAGL